MAGKDLGRRLAVAGVGIPMGVVVVYLGTWGVAVALSIVSALGAREVYLLAEGSGWRPFHLLGSSASALLVLSAAWAGGLVAWGLPATVIVMGLCLAALGGSVFFRKLEERPLASAATTVLGAVYLGSALGFGVHLRGFPGVADGSPGWDGALIVIFPMFVTWIGDSVAYFAGHRWGRRKLIPTVSPGKTVVGAIGGLLGAVLASILFAAVLINAYTSAELSLPAAAVIGVVVACVAQLGDLAESLLKREVGVKDSGGLFPGHGGVLDRFDSILFAVPVTYLLLVLLLER